MKAEDLKKCDVWWKGPDYLLQPETAWPSNRTVNGPIENAELKLGSKLKTPKEIPMTTNHTESQRYEPTFQAFVTTFDSDAQPTIDPRRYSSWLKLRRITAWMMRFVSNCQRKKEERIAGELTEGELKVAEIQLIKEAQREEFTEEYKALTGRRSIPSRSKLLGLTPMLDEDGLIRSNGRLTNAKFLSFDVRYPVILPRKGWVTKLIIKDVHEQGNHASGTNHTLAALSARYWIVSGREAIRGWEKECMVCRRRKSKACQPIMAPLPVSRIETSLRAFTKTAVDYGGPFVTVQGRGKRPREEVPLLIYLYDFEGGSFRDRIWS
ncbi:MAG: integrase zinc binding domain-containing protein [Candidatus Thiodiazotropha sp.]